MMEQNIMFSRRQMWNCNNKLINFERPFWIRNKATIWAAYHRREGRTWKLGMIISLMN
jgi:hypothetical protein